MSAIGTSESLAERVAQLSWAQLATDLDASGTALPGGRTIGPGRSL